MARPKKFDLEVTFSLNGKLRSICVNVKQCQVCADVTVFTRVCPVCGRFNKEQKNVFLQVARESPLNSIRLQDANYEATIPEPKQTEAGIVDFKRTDDDGGEPTAS